MQIDITEEMIPQEWFEFVRSLSITDIEVLAAVSEAIQEQAILQGRDYDKTKKVSEIVDRDWLEALIERHKELARR
jgi:hypothetical protein